MTVIGATGQVSTNLPPLPQEASAAPKKVREWAKVCPLCGSIIASTNHHWSMTSKVERTGNVIFICTNSDCEGLQFWEEIRQPFRFTNSSTMIEITK